MENGKITYRVLGGIMTVVLVLNLFKGLMFLLFGAMYIPPRMDVWLLIGGLIISITTILYLKKTESISYIKKSVISLTIIIVLLLPTFYSFLKPQILSSIIKWESSHCVKTGGSAPGGTPEYKCDNGDLIYKSSENDDGRLFNGGKGTAHFPYWLIY